MRFWTRGLSGHALFEDRSLSLIEWTAGLKYISWVDFLEESGGPERSFVVFPPDLLHSDMRSKACVGKLLGAGFLAVRDGRLVPSGRSESLGVGPDDGDKEAASAFSALLEEGFGFDELPDAIDRE